MRVETILYLTKEERSYLRLRGIDDMTRGIRFLIEAAIEGEPVLLSQNEYHRLLRQYRDRRINKNHPFAEGAAQEAASDEC